MNRQIPDWTRRYRSSSTSTLVYSNRCRFAGFHLVGRTASAGNKPRIVIREGSSTAGSVVVDISASSNYYIEEYYPWPMESLHKLYLEISGSVTGLAGINLFFLPEDEI